MIVTIHRGTDRPPVLPLLSGMRSGSLPLHCGPQTDPRNLSCRSACHRQILKSPVRAAVPGRPGSGTPRFPFSRSNIIISQSVINPPDPAPLPSPATKSISTITVSQCLPISWSRHAASPIPPEPNPTFHRQQFLSFYHCFGRYPAGSSGTPGESRVAPRYLSAFINVLTNRPRTGTLQTPAGTVIAGDDFSAFITVLDVPRARPRSRARIPLLFSQFLSMFWLAGAHGPAQAFPAIPGISPNFSLAPEGRLI
jgi:hypothetical protein